MKTKETIKNNILDVLENTMNHPHMIHFTQTANLVEDLALDSSLTLQLLMYLELEHGLEIPEDTLMKEDFKTIDDVINILFESQNSTQ